MTIILFIFYYFYFSKQKKECFQNEDIKNNSKNNERIEFLESDIYQNLYENLPWEDEDFDGECPGKYMDASQIIETSNLRKPVMIIW